MKASPRSTRRAASAGVTVGLTADGEATALAVLMDALNPIRPAGATPAPSFSRIRNPIQRESRNQLPGSTFTPSGLRAGSP